MTTTSGTGSLLNQPVSVASSSGAGAAGGSVINVAALVAQLVQATEAPQTAIISQETQAVTTQVSALGTLKSALSTFQGSLSALDTPSAFGTETASSSDSTVLTATAGTSAVPGSYAVTVSQLAQAQQLVSGAIAANGTTAVGTGTLSLSLGGSSFNITVDSSNNTLDGIAAAINSASGNPGITASVIQGTNGAHLVLASSLSGAANTIQVSETDGGGALSAFTYGTGNTANYTQTAAAQDAAFTIAGVAYTSASNTVSNALTGVTLNLAGTTASGSSVTLTVATDTATIQSNITAFVSAYNTLQSALKPLGSYDASSNTAGPMMGDALLTGIENQIKQALYSIVNTGSSTYTSLASIGITTNSDGSLSVNNNTLSTALSSDFSAVSALFSGSSGIAANLNTQISADLASGGIVDSRGNTLTQQENGLTQRQDQLNTQMSALSASLTQQYTALNTLLSSLQSTSAYLSQAFASLPLVQGQPKA